MDKQKHMEALDAAFEMLAKDFYSRTPRDLEAAIAKYLEAMDMVSVPNADPDDKVLAGAIKVYNSYGNNMNGMCNVRRFFLAAAPNPFKGE